MKIHVDYITFIKIVVIHLRQTELGIREYRNFNLLLSHWPQLDFGGFLTNRPARN